MLFEADDPKKLPKKGMVGMDALRASGDDGVFGVKVVARRAVKFESVWKMRKTVERMRGERADLVVGSF